MKRYRVKYEMGLFSEIAMHILRWIVLILITGGVAVLFYPFYFIRFLAERITLVEETTGVNQAPPSPPSPPSGESSQP